MERIYKIFPFLVIICIIGTIGFMFYNKQIDKLINVKYINDRVLFENFDMSKDLRRLYQSKLKRASERVDSLYSRFQKGVEKKEEAKHLALYRSELQQAKAGYRDLEHEYTEKMTSQIWRRLHSYIEKYSKEHHIALLIRNGGGSLILYGQDDLDITQPVLDFCNRQYSGIDEK